MIWRRVTSADVSTAVPLNSRVFARDTRERFDNEMRIDRRPRSIAAVVELADMVLRVELDTELGDELELRLQEVDVLLLVVH